MLMEDNTSVASAEGAEPPSAFDIIADMENDVRTTLELSRVAYRLTQGRGGLVEEEATDLHRVIMIVMDHASDIVEAWEEAFRAAAIVKGGQA